MTPMPTTIGTWFTALIVMGATFVAASQLSSPSGSETFWSTCAVPQYTGPNSRRSIWASAGLVIPYKTNFEWSIFDLSTGIARGSIVIPDTTWFQPIGEAGLGVAVINPGNGNPPELAAYNVSAAAVNGSQRQQPQPVWTCSLSLGTAYFFSEPVSSKGMVFVGTGYHHNIVYGINATSGEQVWMRFLGSSDRFGFAAILVLVPSLNAILASAGNPTQGACVFALDQLTGDTLWSQCPDITIDQSEMRYLPVTGSDVVVLTGGYYNIFNLNATTGAILGGQGYQCPGQYGCIYGRLYDADATHGILVLYQSNESATGTLAAMDLTGQTTMWTLEASMYSTEWQVSASPTSGIVYSVHQSGSLIGVDRRTGAQRWAYGPGVVGGSQSLGVEVGLGRLVAVNASCGLVFSDPPQA